MSKTETFVWALSAMLEARGLPMLNEDERTELGDAFMDAVNHEVDEREKANRREDW